MLISQKKRSMGVDVIDVNTGSKTATIFLLLIVFSISCISMAAVAAHADNNLTVTPTTIASITPTPNDTASPTVSASPTAVPTPTARQVFASPKWESDHVTIVVTNSGEPITVVAWIDNISKKATISVGAGETIVVSTPSIQTQSGQIIKFGFDATQNGTAIDSYSATITVGQVVTATPTPTESVTISGLILDDSGSPITGATVTFRSVIYDKSYPAVTTGSDGSYVSPKMYPDVYTVTVTHTGFEPVSLTTNGKITGDAALSPIQLKKLGGTPTPTTAPASPTPANPIDYWISLLYNPALCIGTISSLIAVIAGSIGIYEWMERKRMEREGQGGEKKGESPKPPKI